MDTPDSTTLKRCTKCGEMKPATTVYFYPEKRRSSGLRSDCKDCANARKRLYNRANAEHVKESCRRYNAENNEAVTAQKRQHYAENRNLILERQKQYRDENKDAIRERKRVYDENHKEQKRERGRVWRAKNYDTIRERRQKWSKEHASEVRERSRRWAANNPDARNAQHHLRRARMLEAGGSFTASDIESIRKAQGNRCYLCGKSLKRSYHIDHFIPLAKGGTNDPGNLRLACPHCNLTKHDKHPFEIGRLI